ncbi:hypothetical protein PR202_ga12422 [Eleusine coracana subsp. coracana]|uniref:Large ribosomal subunit protein uL4m n=1 Tax=Eleusine coracana subsp. coracana TaxID=191504 RepID=A0AAV5CBL6_ELECO|nr:hypothetical protein PR202_ga12422 [Eleusine coracana subsp. coracana]
MHAATGSSASPPASGSFASPCVSPLAAPPPFCLPSCNAAGSSASPMRAARVAPARLHCPCFDDGGRISPTMVSPPSHAPLELQLVHENLVGFVHDHGVPFHFAGTHSTKTISEVSGTGRKPYKQKGTGRARHGTLRGPQFRGGATMHGPKPRSHAIKLQKKVRRLGLKVALSARTAEGKLLVYEDLEVPSHKTKNIVNYISQMDGTKKVLLVDGGDIDKKLKLATQNLHYVNVLPSIGLNVYSILQHDTLVMTRDAVNRIVERMHTPYQPIAMGMED